MKMHAVAEVREVANEALQLLVLAVGSMALVFALAFALLGGETTFATTGSIETASQWVVGILVATGLAYLVASRRRPPGRFELRAAPDGLWIGDKKRLGPVAPEKVLVIASGARWAVELSGRATLVRILFDERDEAERFAGALLGRERLAAADLRVRQKASYIVFVLTISAWVLVYSAICVLPLVPVLGAILLAFLLPPALWVGLRALPAQWVVSGGSVIRQHPLGATTWPRHEIRRTLVSDDDCLELVLADGDVVRVADLVHHPRDPVVSDSPSTRLANAVGVA